MYEVEIIGIDNLHITKIAQTDYILNELKNTVLPEIGNIIRKYIQDRISKYEFKNSKGNMYRAVTVEVDRDNLEVIIYNDYRIAPHAIWQEKGVRKHKMEYLEGKTIPYVIINGKFMFAGKGSSSFMQPGTRFAKITKESFNKINPSTGKPKWEHPGYPGKFLYRDGLKDAISEIEQRFNMFTFKIATEVA